MMVNDNINFGYKFKLFSFEGWLSITGSRNGIVFISIFHLLCSGIGFQALLLPLAFAILGWVWGTIALSLVFVWKFYTSWILANLHESVFRTRYSRFIRLLIIAFGPKLGKLLAIFPVMYLSSGLCVKPLLKYAAEISFVYNKD